MKINVHYNNIYLIILMILFQGDLFGQNNR